MSVARNGSVVVLNTNTNVNASGSGTHETLTIPSSTTLMLLWIGAFSTAPVANYISGGAVEVGGSNGVIGDGGTAMSIARAQDSNTSFTQGCAFYLINPPIGSKNIAWDYVGTGDCSSGAIFLAVFFTGTHATTPIGAVGGTQGSGSPLSSAALANAVGDMVVGFSVYNTANAAPTSGWTNLTLVQGAVEKFDDWASYAETDGTGSDITPTATWVNGDDGAMVAFVLKAAAAGGDLSVNSIGEPVIGGSTF